MRAAQRRAEEPANPVSAGDDAGTRALDRLIEAGFGRIEPPILQPASVFLDMSGEDIRGRLYLTGDADGAAASALALAATSDMRFRSLRWARIVGKAKHARQSVQE